MNYPHVASIRRKTKTGSKYTFGSVGTTKCFLQPLSAEETQIVGVAYGKAFICYVPLETVIKDHDRLVIDSENYGLAGLKRHNYGNLHHQKLTLEKL